MIHAAIKIAPGTVLELGDYLVHSKHGAKPQGDSTAAVEAFARVVDPTPGEKAPDGSYRVKCEMLIRHPYRAERN